MAAGCRCLQGSEGVVGAPEGAISEIRSAGPWSGQRGRGQVSGAVVSTGTGRGAHGHRGRAWAQGKLVGECRLPRVPAPCPQPPARTPRPHPPPTAPPPAAPWMPSHPSPAWSRCVQDATRWQHSPGGSQTQAAVAQGTLQLPGILEPSPGEDRPCPSLPAERGEQSDTTPTYGLL